MNPLHQPKLSIFETFKTKTDELTGEANRQRAILVVLATQTNPTEKTRTAIAQRIAEENGAIWKNIYSGIFRDLDEILIPLGLVEEEGRLPLKRGPRALQEKGIPYYHLTSRGLLVSSALSDIVGRDRILMQFFENQNSDTDLREILEKLISVAPRFSYGLLEKYVKAYCDGKLKDLLPFSMNSLKIIVDDSIVLQREMIKGFIELGKNEREKVLNFLDKLT